MSSRKRLVGISLALTLAVSAAMLVKTMLMSPKKGITVKTGSSGVRAWEEKPEEKPEAVEVKAVPVQEAEPAVRSAEEEKEAPAAAAAESVNINTATVEELEALPGIGDYLAQQIVSYRSESGEFETAEDIKRVPGIGPAKYKAIRELISVGD